MYKRNQRAKALFKLLLQGILFTIFGHCAYAQDAEKKHEQETVVINGKFRDDILLLNSKTKKLKRGRNNIYTFRINILKNATEQITIAAIQRSSTRKTDLPDIIKGLISQPNASKFAEDSIQDTESLDLKDIKIKDDYTIIEISVSKKSAPQKVITKTYEFSNYGYIKPFVFSSGLFGNNLVNNEFNLSSDGKKITREKTPKNDIAFGAMANFNYVASPSFKIGLGLGMGLSPLDTKSRILLGPSFTIGRKNEFVFLAGIAYARLTALSSLISTNGKDYDIPVSDIVTITNVQTINTTTGVITTTQTTTTVPNTFKTVPIYNKWQHGAYIGFTYSLLKK